MEEAADEAVLNIVHKKKKKIQKNPPLIIPFNPCLLIFRAAQVCEERVWQDPQRCPLCGRGDQGDSDTLARAEGQLVQKCVFIFFF